MKTELHLLETVSLPYEAENMQRVLETAGIEAFIEGVNGSNAFGMNALMGRIRIKVRAEDLPQARQVLSESFNRIGPAWYCGSCQEMNEPSFDICWQCGGQREEVESEKPTPPKITPTKIRAEDMLSQRPVHDQFNPAPYAPPAADPALPASEPITTPTQEEYEETIERAYRASILGLVTLPGILHIYSLVLLLGALSLPAETTARISMRFTAAMTINLVVFLAIGWLFFIFPMR